MTTWTDRRTAHRPVALSSTGGIDRAAHHRLDEAWLAAAWSHPTTRCFVVSGGQVLIDETADGRTELVMTPAFEAPLTEAHRYFLGISVPSDGWHAPNEKVELDLLLKGVETSAYLWGDLAENFSHAP